MGPPPALPSRTFALLLAAAVAVLAGLLALQAGALGRVEGEATDLRFHIRGAARPSDVVVVAIDERTFSDLRVQWPFPRALHAQLLERLRRDHALAVVYDVQFTEPSDPTDDLRLYEAVTRTGHVVLATTEVDAAGHAGVLGGEQNLRAAGAVAAASNLPSEAGVIRRYPFSTLGLPSLAAAAARAAGHPVRASAFPSGGAWIDYRGAPGTVPTYSFSDVLSGRVDPRLLAGRVVVVGASAPTLQDVHQTSTTGSRLMSGPEIQANAIWTVLHGNPLRRAPWWLAVLTVVAGALLAPLVCLRRRPLVASLTALAAAAIYLVAAQLLFDAGWIVAVVYPLLALVVGAVGMIAASYVGAFVERNQFSHELRESQLELIQRLAQAVEQRDAETGAHIRRIGVLSRRLALAAGSSEQEAEMLRHASAMHDVGKIGIPDAVLLKPDALDPAEWKVIMSHTKIGGEILASSSNPLVQMAETIARHHHERWDGSGYPDGLAGADIPFVARICAVCDVFDALLSTRVYKQAWSVEDALAEIRRGSGTAFDPALVEKFVAIVPEMLAELEQIEQPSAHPPEEPSARPPAAPPSRPRSARASAPHARARRTAART